MLNKEPGANLYFGLGFFSVVFSSRAEAASCGGKNQKACPVLKKGKVCKNGLKKKKGICVVNDNKASKEFINKITAFKKNTSHAKALGDFHACMKKNGREKTLHKAIKAKNSATASRVVNICLTPDIRKKLSTKPKGLSAGDDPHYFNTLSVGLGGGIW